MRDFYDRFTIAERTVHWLVAILMASCLVTGVILYNGPIMMAVGHRHVVETVHLWSGLALPVPMVLGVLSVAYRADLGRLNRFSRKDWQWLRHPHQREGSAGVGKFNAGQKINAWLVAGATGVLLGTGVLMHWTGLVQLSWRSGATFVHDWAALALGLLIIGHITYALMDPEARRGMRTGKVTVAWARAEHEEWADEMQAVDGDDMGMPRG